MQKTLVFLPGVLSDQRVWSYQVNHLQDCVTCLVMPLLEGNRTEDLVQRVLTGVDGNFFLAGHSMGGWLALEVARKAPERILKLCLLNTSAQQDSAEKDQKRKAMIEEVEQGGFHRVVALLTDLYVHKDGIKKEVFSMMLGLGKQVFINQQQALLSRRECASLLPQLSMPTLVIHARQDKNFSLTVHEELAAKIPNAKLAVVEDSGHMCPMEAPQAVTALLRFWLDYF